MNDLVSILIPVYNREKLISETIECAINQTYKNVELVICDNASTDGTWGILENYAQKDPRIKIFRNEENVGPVLNWKKCLDNATGEYGKILWSDDLISETFIEHTLPLFDEETAFVMTGFCVFESSIDHIVSRSTYQLKTKYHTADYIYNILIANRIGFPVSPGCALFRLKDLKKSFVLDIENEDHIDHKQFGAGNDLLFFLITAIRYKYIKVFNDIESYYRSHQESLTISSNLGLNYEWTKLFFIKNYQPSLLRYYKAKIFLRRVENKKKRVLYKYLYLSISSPLSCSALLGLVAKKMKL
jgi:glycosyltransferase involved in cell wall biosynthesis